MTSTPSPIILSTPAKKTPGGTPSSIQGSPESVKSSLRQQLLVERQRTAHLEGELLQLRKSAVENSQQAEAEEECLINRMMKRLLELKKEKEDLALEVEREEELLTNTLQKKLNQLRQEKVDLENQLEREQEYIVNKLRKQLAQVTAEKERMALEVEREEEFLTNKLAKKLDKLKLEKEEVEVKLREEEKELAAIKHKYNEMGRKLEEGLCDLEGRLESVKSSRQQELESQPMTASGELGLMEGQIKALLEITRGVAQLPLTL